MISVDQIAEPGWTPSRRHERVQLKFVHDSIDALSSREQVIGCERIQVFFAGQRVLGLRFDQNILSKIGHFFFLVAFIEYNDVL